MRLIDANKIKQSVTNEMLMAELNSSIYCTLECVVTDIDSQPTAYDVDKVVEKLQTELSLADKEKKRCTRENPLQFDTGNGYAYGISVALDIIKSGGVS